MTGWDSLKLEIGFQSNALDEPQVYTDVIGDLESAKTDDGRDNVLDHFPAGTGEFRLDNGQRKYDPLNHASPYTSTYLDMPGASGDYVTAPDSAQLSPTGDVDIRVKLAATDWTPGGSGQVLISKWGSAGQRSWAFGIHPSAPNGALWFRYSPDGTAGSTETSTIATGFVDGTTHWVRVTLDVNDGGGNRVYKFYTSSDGSTWSQLGATVTVGATISLLNTTSPIEIGSSAAGTAERLVGHVYRVVAYSDLTTTTKIIDVNFAFGIGAGVTTVTDDAASPNVWTLHGATSIIWVESLVKPKKRVRISALDSGSVRRDIWNGTVDAPDGWQFGYDPPSVAWVDLKCSGHFALFAAFDFTPDESNAVYTGVDPTTTVSDALTSLFGFMPIPPEWYPVGSISDSAERINPGSGPIVNGYLVTGSMLDIFYKLADSEGGEIFMSRPGYVTFHDRHFPIREASMATVQATFSDTGSDVDFDDVPFGFGVALVNDVRANRAASWSDAAQTVPVSDADIDQGKIFRLQDTAAQAESDIQSKALDDLWLSSDPQAYARAELLLNQRKDPLYAPIALVLAPMDANNILDQALQRELTDRITLTWNPPGGGSAVTVDCFIQKISHDIPVKDDPRRWTTTFVLSPASLWGFTSYGDYLILDDATKGKLNTARLAF